MIVTDDNGYASTSSEWNKHTSNTNRGESSEDGIWFGTSKPDDSKGALIYDTYILEEQRCDSNKGMDLLKFEVKVYKDSVTVKLGTLTDDAIEIGTKLKFKTRANSIISTLIKIYATVKLSKCFQEFSLPVITFILQSH